MGATIGLSQFLWLATAINTQYAQTANITGSVAYFIQQCVVMNTLYTLTKCLNFVNTSSQEIKWHQNQIEHVLLYIQQTMYSTIYFVAQLYSCTVTFSFVHRKLSLVIIQYSRLAMQ